MSWKLSGLVKSITHTPSGKKLSPSEKLFLLILADYSDEHTGICWPSVQRLANECLCSETTIQRMTRAMTDAGFISVDYRKGQSNHYRLIVPKTDPLQIDTPRIAMTPHPLHSYDTLAVKEPSDTKNKKVLLSQLPTWLPVPFWNDYLKMRLRIRKPLVTDRGIALAINRLEKFRQEGHDPATVLEWSILNSYQGLFPPKVDLAAPASIGKTPHVVRKCERCGSTDDVRRTVDSPIWLCIECFAQEQKIV